MYSIYCHRKNKLYKDFLKKRTFESELKYKNYKNKLTSIMGFSEKRYYNELLSSHKGNVRRPWNILNSIIKKKKQQLYYPGQFIPQQISIDNPKEIANSFNKYFADVGPDLAKFFLIQ